jgi:hypothetical protein
MLLKNPSKNWRPTIQLAGAAIFGGIFSGSLMRYLVNYDVFTRFVNASEYHAKWKGWDSGLETLVNAGLTNVVEFAVWLGLPLSILFVVMAFFAICRILKKRKVSLFTGLTLALVLTFILLILFGRTKAETARLWIFLIPYICILVAPYLIDKKNPSGIWRFVPLWIVVLLEFITTILTLRFQDFW